MPKPRTLVVAVSHNPALVEALRQCLRADLPPEVYAVASAALTEHHTASASDMRADPESLRAWLDENPDERKKLAAGR
jgi:hypothetical protein